MKRYLGRDFNYTYKGILNALKYYYEILKHPATMEYNTLGIVPYCYQKAQEHFEKIKTAKEINKDVGEIVVNIREIRIPPPKVEKKKIEVFKFLEEDT